MFIDLPKASTRNQIWDQFLADKGLDTRLANHEVRLFELSAAEIKNIVTLASIDPTTATAEKLKSLCSLEISQRTGLLHRDEADRFADREKYALWSRMYGVGGIITGHSNCIGFGPVFKGRCKQNLMLISATTGEYIASAETEATTGANGAWGASWEDAVEALNENSPKTLEKPVYTQELEYERSVAEEHAKRQKEIVGEAAARGVTPSDVINKKYPVQSDAIQETQSKPSR